MKKGATKKGVKKRSATERAGGSHGKSSRPGHYFMAELHEDLVESFRGDLHKALVSKLGEVVFISVTSDWSPDSSAEVIATLSADIHPYTDMDAVMTDAAEVVRTTAVKALEGALVIPAVPSPTAPAPEPKTYPVVLDRKQLRKEPGCIFVDVREITFRSEFQIELYLSTNNAKKKWKDDVQ